MPVSKETALEKIKRRAYWQVEFFPAEFVEEALSMGEIPNVINQSAVDLRGWDYPHVVTQNMEDRQESYPMQNEFYEAWIDWSVHKELWRQHKSGKFVHLFAVHEQWFEEYEGVFAQNPYPDLEAKYLDVVNVVFKVTEILEFLKNLASHVSGVENFVLRIQLKNAEDNELAVLDRSRIPLSGNYKNRTPTVIAYDGPLSRGLLLNKESRDELGTQIIQTIFSHFDGWQWTNEVIEGERQKLLERRIL